MMHVVSLAGVSIALSADGFAIALGVGLHRAELTRRRVFRLSFHFGLFQALML